MLAEVERFLARQSGPLLDPKGREAPTVTQWQYLRQRTNACDAYGPETQTRTFLRELTELHEHSQKPSGAPWAPVIGALPRAIGEVVGGFDDGEQFERARLFIDALVQQLAARERARREKEARPHRKERRDQEGHPKDE